MTSRFHHRQRSHIAASELLERGPIIKKTPFFKYFAFPIQHTKPVPAIPQIQSYRDAIAFIFLLHKASSLPQRQNAALSPPSHLIWLGLGIATILAANQNTRTLSPNLCFSCDTRSFETNCLAKILPKEVI